MLHIHNGEASANTLQQSHIEGQQFAFRDALINGPTPAGVSGTDWRHLRADHLADSYGVDREQCELGLQQQEEALASYADHQEVVLWFEHDLFCQVNLIYLLDWFQGRDLGQTKLSLICIGEFPDVEDFRGLGQLTAAQLASLFEQRHDVTAAELELASAAWEAYRNSDPTTIKRLLSLNTAALPFLQNALRCHLARFPSTKNGLGFIENRSLELIEQGQLGFADLFKRFGETAPVYGLGDFQFWLALRKLVAAQQPLLLIEDNNVLNSAMESAKLRDLRFSCTELGNDVLRGRADFVTANGIDEWLGGVHLLPESLWRWDEANEKLSVTGHHAP
jgi:hypothetical protein